MIFSEVSGSCFETLIVEGLSVEWHAIKFTRILSKDHCHWLYIIFFLCSVGFDCIKGIIRSLFPVFNFGLGHICDYHF